MDAGTLDRSLGVRARDMFRHLLFPPQHSKCMNRYALFQLMSDASLHANVPDSNGHLNAMPTLRAGLVADIGSCHRSDRHDTAASKHGRFWGGVFLGKGLRKFVEASRPQLWMFPFGGDHGPLHIGINACQVRRWKRHDPHVLHGRPDKALLVRDGVARLYQSHEAWICRHRRRPPNLHVKMSVQKLRHPAIRIS